MYSANGLQGKAKSLAGYAEDGKELNGLGAVEWIAEAEGQ